MTLNHELTRYATPRMERIWSADWKFETWKHIEINAAQALGAPDKALIEMNDAPHPSAAEVAREEQVTRHDVVAFLNCWRRNMGEAGRSWTHRGLTSSDIVDTTNGLRMSQSSELIQDRLKDLRTALAAQALIHQHTVRVGRTHGQTAEVTTWGWRMAEFAYAVDRALRRLRVLDGFFSIGKMSGPVGDYKQMGHQVEEGMLLDLGLENYSVTSQIVMRDGYVDYLHALAQIANVIDAIALEVRLSSRSDTGEVAEGFAAGQRGSSAMPHKRNPVTSEQLTGLARLVRAQVDPVAQGVASHHERDISHSSVERIALQTASILTDYMATTATRVIKELNVDVEAMRRRVTESPELLSSMIKDLLVENGTDPKVAYDLVFAAFADSRIGWHGTLVNALIARWGRLPDEMKPDGGRWLPDFHAFVRLLETPEELLGETGHVYDQIRTLGWADDDPHEAAF